MLRTRPHHVEDQAVGLAGREVCAAPQHLDIECWVVSHM